MLLRVQPETKYARKDGVHVAYQVVGDGPQDLVLVSTWFSHLEERWELPGFARYLERLASFSRLISFDKRGIGLSDPVPLDRLPLLEEWMDDVLCVMEAAGSERAAIMGANEGTLMAALFAATHPDRVTSLVLVNATGKPGWSEDHPWGVPPEAVDALVELMDDMWGQGAFLATLNPSIEGDEQAQRAWNRFLRLSASPAVAAAVTRALSFIDIRAVLPTIRVPTLVVQRRDNPLFPSASGKDVADRIPGSKFVELPGADYGVVMGDVDAIVDEVEEFLTGSRPMHDADRVLATVLFTDIVDSTSRAIEFGDHRWKEILDFHERVSQREVGRHGGVIADFAGDGLLARFDGPARAVRCALTLRDEFQRHGVDIRAGLHTGEVELRGERVAGIGVHIAARVMSVAQPNDVLVSRTVKDLVAGSGLDFHDRGTHELKGVPDAWQIFLAEG
jgi:class 3 adenylate cyclase